MAKKSKSRRHAAAPDAKPAKRNLLKMLGVNEVDYKDTNRLRMFISPKGFRRDRR